MNLVGEHVDYNGGLCLPMALPHATYAAVAVRDDDTVTVRSGQQDDEFSGRLDELGPGSVTGWASYAAGVVWAMQEAGWTLPGMDLVVDSRVPLGAGLSSSAALECAVALAAASLTDQEVDDEVRSGLVRACMRAEAEVAGAPTGGLDQTVALFGEAESALLLDCRDWSTRQVRWDPAAADLTLLVVDTRASHTLSDGGYGSRRADCERAADELGVALLRDVDDQAAALASLDDRVRPRVRHVFTEIDRVRESVAQLEAGDFEALGRTFLASHASLRDDYEVSCDGARRRRRHRRGPRRARRPDDRRRVRRVGDRPRADLRGRRGGGRRAGGVRRPGLGLPRLPDRAAERGRPPAALSRASGYVALTPPMRPSRNASTNSAWSWRTVTA